MLKTLKITAAREQLTSLKKTMRADETIAVTNRGKKVLALMRWEKYDAILETLNILEDEELMEKLRQSLKEAREGKIISIDDLDDGADPVKGERVR
ncbi:MAG TPA: type II toxin-antitoxin system Phd/YefM family antitoxin [Spirochaetia bacterium]